jgi:hypothetical protein
MDRRIFCLRDRYFAVRVRTGRLANVACFKRARKWSSLPFSAIDFSAHPDTARFSLRAFPYASKPAGLCPEGQLLLVARYLTRNLEATCLAGGHGNRPESHDTPTATAGAA